MLRLVFQGAEFASEVRAARPCLCALASASLLPPSCPALQASLTRTLMPPCEDAEEGFNVRWLQCAARGLVQGLQTKEGRMHLSGRPPPVEERGVPELLCGVR